MFIDPTGGAYTFDYVRWIAGLVTRAYRACRRKRRGPRILFAAATVTIYTTVGVFTDYLVTHNTRMSQCITKHCSPAQLAANQQFLDGFGWTVFYTMMCFTTAFVCILTLVLKVHEDLAWSIPARKLMMQYYPGHPLDKLESKIRRFLLGSMCVLLVLGFVFVFVLYEYARNST